MTFDRLPDLDNANVGIVEAERIRQRSEYAKKGIGISALFCFHCAAFTALPEKHANLKAAEAAEQEEL